MLSKKLILFLCIIAVFLLTGCRAERGGEAALVKDRLTAAEAKELISKSTLKEITTDEVRKVSVIVKRNT